MFPEFNSTLYDKNSESETNNHNPHLTWKGGAFQVKWSVPKFAL
jgi:hypothetical protein